MSRELILGELQDALRRATELAELLEAPQAPPAAPTPPAPPAAVLLGPFKDAGAFYDWLRDDDMLGPKISADEFKGCSALTDAMGAASWACSWTAYGLATAYLETAMTMLPVKERGGAAYYRRMYDIQGQRPAKARELGNIHPGDGVLFCGRGYPQLTGRTNYERATKAVRAAGIQVDLVANPDLAMRPDIAAVIMISGMQEGWFTSRKLAHYLPPSGDGIHAQFKEARRIINGQDKADAIAGFALKFQKALRAGGWRFG